MRKPLPPDAVVLNGSDPRRLPSVIWTRELMQEIAEREHGPQIRADRARRRAEALSLLRRVVKLLEQDA